QQHDHEEQGEPGDVPGAASAGIDANGQWAGQVKAQPVGPADLGEPGPDAIHDVPGGGVAVRSRGRHRHHGLDCLAVLRGAAITPRTQTATINQRKRTSNLAMAANISGGRRAWTMEQRTDGRSARPPYRPGSGRVRAASSGGLSTEASRADRYRWSPEVLPARRRARRSPG